MKAVKFPDGYASNNGRCVSVNDDRLFGLKSHDCYVLLEQLLPIGIRPHLKNEVCEAIVELSNFFWQLCAKTMTEEIIVELEKGIVLIICKFECIFPPAFFDIMVHSAVHLPREARYGGLVTFRWMYPIKR